MILNEQPSSDSSWCSMMTFAMWLLCGIASCGEIWLEQLELRYTLQSLLIFLAVVTCLEFLQKRRFEHYFSYSCLIGFEFPHQILVWLLQNFELCSLTKWKIEMVPKKVGLPLKISWKPISIPSKFVNECLSGLYRLVILYDLVK